MTRDVGRNSQKITSLLTLLEEINLKLSFENFYLHAQIVRQSQEIQVQILKSQLHIRFVL